MAVKRATKQKSKSNNSAKKLKRNNNFNTKRIGIIKLNPIVLALFVSLFGFIGYKTLGDSNAQGSVLYNDIDKYCKFHVMGSLYGDGEGNGPPNGANWKTPNSYWVYSPSVNAQADRFEYCAEQMTESGGGTVTRIDNKITLKNFSLDLPFDELPKSLTDQYDPRAYRAFLTSVVEGEGNAAGKIDDNFKCVNNGTSCNPFYAKHVIALGTAITKAGMGHYFVSGDGAGCSTSIVSDAKIQLLSDNDSSNDPQTGGLSVCIDKSNLDFFASLQHAACTNRIPGGTTKCTQLVADIIPPTTPTNFVVNGVDSSHVQLSWQASTDASGIKKYIIIKNGAWYVGVKPPNTTFYDKNIEPGKTYYYRVRAVDNNGNKSEASTTLKVVIPN